MSLDFLFRTDEFGALVRAVASGDRPRSVHGVLYELGLETARPGDYGLGLRWSDASGAAWIETSLPVRIL